MANHADLTGADLHEPKGIAGTAANLTYISDGLGSGVWRKTGLSDIDTVSVLTLNQLIVTVKVTDIASPSVVVVPIPFNCTLVSATSCITGAISGADSTLTFTRAGAATIGTIVIDDLGSGEGILDNLSAPVNNTFTGPSWLKIASDGAPTGGTSDAYVMITLLRT